MITSFNFYNEILHERLSMYLPGPSPNPRLQTQLYLYLPCPCLPLHSFSFYFIILLIRLFFIFSLSLFGVSYSCKKYLNPFYTLPCLCSPRALRWILQRAKSSRILSMLQVVSCCLTATPSSSPPLPLSREDQPHNRVLFRQKNATHPEKSTKVGVIV